MEYEIFIFYLNKRNQINYTPKENFNLINEIKKTFSIKENNDDFFYSYDLYSQIFFTNSQTNDFYLNNQNDFDNFIINIKNEIKKINIFVLKKSEKKINEELINKIHSLKNENSRLLNEIEHLKEEINNLRRNGYEIKFIKKNNQIKFRKKDINNESIKYVFKIKINNYVELPKNTFLRCIPDNNDIFFLPIKDYSIINYNEKKNQYIYSFIAIILFKNIHNIQIKKYELNCELINDKIGKIGEENGYLCIEIIDD
jgi:hypothetical protein